MNQQAKDLPQRKPNFFGASVRKGAPHSFGGDLYFQLMHRRWWLILLVFLMLYLGLNLLFALAYWSIPNSITNARPEAFSDYFFFSVQTLATIGYGVMAPQNFYGHILVTLEAGLGLIGLAMMTGVMFAKLSRPQAKVLFSRAMVMTQMDGRRVLSFRVANARTNDIGEASVRLVMLRQDTTPEGQRIRRMIDVPLVRDNSPFFRLSWTIMHVLDEQSPVQGMMRDGGLAGELQGFVVTITGHDGTYGQTIFANHFYQCADILDHHRFVDVLSELPDGRVLIDYTKFHLTIPEVS